MLLIILNCWKVNLHCINFRLGSVYIFVFSLCFSLLLIFSELLYSYKVSTYILLRTVNTGGGGWPTHPFLQGNLVLNVNLQNKEKSSEISWRSV